MGLLDDLQSAPDAGSPSGEQQYAEAWRPVEGQGVEGVVMSVDSRVTEMSPDGYPIVTLMQPSGQPVAVHGIHSVLRDEMLKANLRVGDQFAVIFDGQRQGASGRSFYKYRTRHVAGAGVAPVAVAPQGGVVPGAAIPF